MSRSIVYIQEQHPNVVETFIRAEINELIRRQHPVAVATLRKMHENLHYCNYADKIHQATPDSLVQLIASLKPSYLHAHFVTEAVKFALPVAEALNVPFGFTAHAYDLWLRGHRIEPEAVTEILIVGIIKRLFEIRFSIVRDNSDGNFDSCCGLHWY